MLTICKHIRQADELVLHWSIFPRPTPWLVAWKALLQPKIYRFVYIHKVNDRLNYFSNRGFLTITDENGETVQKTKMLPMSFGLWIEYILQSYLYGYLLFFWRWSWAERKLEERERHRTSRIEQED